MLNQFFGHYLLNRGLLESEELCNAIRQEKQVKVKLGTLAVNQGLMTAAQVEEVHALQQRCDQLFGKLAVEMGYLNQEEVEQLLAQQQEEPLALLQAISDQGYLPLAKLEHALRKFRSEYGMEPGYDATLPYPLHLLFPFLVEEDAAIYLEAYVGLLLRNMERFLDVPSYLPCEEETKLSVNSAGYVVTQKIYGDKSFFTGLRLREKALLELASRFYGEQLNKVDELALDCVGEFLNVHNGVFCGLLSGKGVWADLEAQQANPFGCELQSRIYRLDIGTSFGPLEMLFAVQ